jgi:hypothetical protein
MTGCAARTDAVPVSAAVNSALQELINQPDDLGAAHKRAQEDCLRRARFDVPRSTPTAGGKRATFVGVDGLFASRDEAKALGYGATIRETASHDAFEDSLSAAERERFTRVADGDDSESVEYTLSSGAKIARTADGCRAEADKAVYGSVKNGLVLDNFINEILAEAGSMTGDANTIMVTGFTRYAPCMRKNGYSLVGFDAGKVAEKRFGQYRLYGERPSAAEQAMAAHDFDCQQEAGFAKKLDALFLSKASPWIASHESMILGTRELLDASMKRAHALLDATSAP